MTPESELFVYAAGAPPAITVGTRPNAWSRGVSHAFFLFFTSPILSPYLDQKTIYLFWIVPILDPLFLKYLLRSAAGISGQRWWATGALLLWFAAVAPESCLRWSLMLWSLAYLWYAFEQDLFYLGFWMVVNVAVAVLQALTYWGLGPAAAMQLGPNNIAATVWGPYATRTFTNFYSIVPGFDLPRFSGLSREGGFFASLLATVVLLKVSERQRIGLPLWLGIVLSLSKSTAFLALGWIVTAIGAKDRRTPALLFLPFLLCFCLAYFLCLDGALMEGRISPTFTQRLYPYAALFHDLDLQNLLAGSRLSPHVLAQFKSFQLCVNVESYVNCLEMPSFAALIYAAGIVGLCLYLWQLAALGVTLWGVLLIFILTSNVSPLSNTSFVVLSYFLAMRVSGAGGPPPRGAV